MIAAVHQPHYMPWLGYIDKIDRCDVFCFLDNVQYKKNDWQNRNRIKTASGWQWLTLPVRFRFPQKINEVTINDSVDWRRKHLQALTTNYRKSPFFVRTFDALQPLYREDWQSLVELNIELVKTFLSLLGLADKPTVRASELSGSDDPNERLIEICQALGCNTYLAGDAGSNYMDLARFEERGITIVFQQFNHPQYPQLFGDFISHLSVVDLLFNCGPESMRTIREANPRKDLDSSAAGQSE